MSDGKSMRAGPSKKSLKFQKSLSSDDSLGSSPSGIQVTDVDDTVPHDLGRQLSLDNAGTARRLEIENPEAPRSSRADSAFKQQMLLGWHPKYSMGKLYWKFLVAGLLYIPLGIVLILSSNSLTEIVVPYTDCVNVDDPTTTCAEMIEAFPGSTCRCEVEFNITKDINSQVYMYYALTNFFQNHRMYVRSRDNEQMLGDIGTENNLKSLSKECEYYDYITEKDSDGKSVTKRIIPCGAIANSLFNDSITLCLMDEYQPLAQALCSPVDLNRTGIAWESDKKYKFKNPTYFDAPDHNIWKQFARPRDWNRSIWDLDPGNPENNGLQNEDFIVWMRTAALSNFRKPYRIINQDKLLAGTYKLKIEYSYKTKSFGGTKSIVICTQSPLIGSKNPVIGITFSVTGGVAIVIALVFLYIYITTHRRSNLIRPAAGPSEKVDKKGGRGAPDDTRSEVIDDTRSEVIDVTRSEVIDVTRSEVIDVTSSEVIDVTRSEVIDVTSSEVIDSTRSEVIDSTRSEIIDGTRSEVIDDAGSDIIDDAGSDIIDDTRSDVVDDAGRDAFDEDDEYILSILERI